MNTKEKILHTSPTEVRLYKEGIFWTAYEQSAFLLSQVYTLKPSKRFVKVAEQEVVTVGFPDKTLDKILSPAMEMDNATDAALLILRSKKVFDEKEFEKWKQEIPLKIVEKAAPAAVVPEMTSTGGLYSDLPVFRACYELLRFVYRESGNMTRTYRFTLGQNLQNAMTELLLNIYRANCDFDKRAHIARARENTEMVRLMLRVGYDEGQLKLKQYIFANTQVESISKQLTAWGKYSKKLTIDNELR